MLRSESGPVTLVSTYIGQVETLYYQQGQPLVRVARRDACLSGWLFRVNFRMPFDTGVMIASGTPPRKLDPTGTASRLLVTVDNAAVAQCPGASPACSTYPLGTTCSQRS